MDYHCGKFGDCTFSRFGFIVQIDRQTPLNTNTPATVVGVSNDSVSN